jgi:hypothetical protein
MAQVHHLSSTQRMANAILGVKGTSLEAFLRTYHESGSSYEQIARELDRATDGAVAISYSTVKRWLIDFALLEEAAS